MNSITMTLFLATFAFGGISQASPSSIDYFQWENRLLILNTDDTERIEEWEELYCRLNPEFEDRKLLVFRLKGDDQVEHFLQFIHAEEVVDINLKRTQEWRKRDGIRLIGLDGKTKAFWSFDDFDLEKMWMKIDSMPMRSAELRSREKNET